MENLTLLNAQYKISLHLAARRTRLLPIITAENISEISSIQQIWHEQQNKQINLDSSLSSMQLIWN